MQSRESKRYKRGRVVCKPHTMLLKGSEHWEVVMFLTPIPCRCPDGCMVGYFPNCPNCSHDSHSGPLLGDYHFPSHVTQWVGQGRSVWILSGGIGQAEAGPQEARFFIDISGADGQTVWYKQGSMVISVYVVGVCLFPSHLAIQTQNNHTKTILCAILFSQ